MKVHLVGQNCYFNLEVHLYFNHREKPQTNKQTEMQIFRENEVYPPVTKFLRYNYQVHKEVLVISVSCHIPHISQEINQSI